GDEGVGARLGDLADVLHVDAAVDLQADFATAGIDQRTRFAQLVEGAGDELLPAETGVDAHQQDHVDLVHHVLEHVQRGSRVEHQTGLGAAVLDQLQRAVDVLGRFRVKGDVRGTGLDEVTDDAIHRLDHQVRVDGRGDAVLAQRRADHRADGQIGHIVVVHDIEVDDVRPGGEDVVHFLPQTGEVGGKDRRGEGEGLHGAPQEAGSRWRAL